jgi:ABC-type multidrug transport system fused ATPase/permease subunit
LPRFYDATAGQVTIDGIDVRHAHLDDLRHSIGMVFQENFLIPPD